MNGYIQGYDISSMQGTNIPFAQMANNGTKFCIFRNGIGNDGSDGNYKTYVNQATSSGILCGAYNFIYPLPPQQGNPTRDPVQQAQMHWATAENQNVPVHAIDCEWPLPTDWARWGCSASQLNDWMLTYLQEYARLLGKNPCIYTYPDWANNVHFSSDFTNYPLWIASYQSSPAIPSPWNDWVLWQASGGTDHLPNGVPVDVDYAKDLSLWSVSSASTAPVISPIPMINTDPAPVVQTPTPASVNDPTTLPDPQPAVQTSATVAPIITQGNDILTQIMNFVLMILKSLLRIK